MVLSLLSIFLYVVVMGSRRLKLDNRPLTLVFFTAINETFFIIFLAAA